MFVCKVKMTECELFVYHNNGSNIIAGHIKHYSFFRFFFAGFDGTLDILACTHHCTFPFFFLSPFRIPKVSFVNYLNWSFFTFNCRKYGPREGMYSI